MPDRIITHTLPFLAYAVEALLLGAIGGYKLTQAIILGITEQDWTRLLGPQGFTVGLILAVIVLWGNGLMREKNENKRREKEEAKREARHVETIGLQRENSDKLMALTVESIKAQGMSASAISRLVDELEARPCSAGKPFGTIQEK